MMLYVTRCYFNVSKKQLELLLLSWLLCNDSSPPQGCIPCHRSGVFLAPALRWFGIEQLFEAPRDPQIVFNETL